MDEEDQECAEELERVVGVAGIAEHIIFRWRVFAGGEFPCDFPGTAVGATCVGVAREPGAYLSEVPGYADWVRFEG